MISNNSLESIRKIQEDARRKVQEALNQIDIVNTTPNNITDILYKLKREINFKIKETIYDYFCDLKKSIVEINIEKKQYPCDIIPHNCRLYHIENNLGFFIIEFLPMRRTLFIGKEKKSVNVPFPYFYFYVCFHEDKNGKFSIRKKIVGARNSSLTSIYDKIYFFPICHTTKDSVCLPMDKIYFDSPKEIADNFIQSFWQSSFVYEFNKFVVNRKKIDSWEDWEKIDVMDMLKMKFKIGTLVKDLLIFGNNSAKFQNLIGRFELNVQNAIMECIDSLNLEKFLVKCSLQQ